MSFLRRFNRLCDWIADHQVTLLGVAMAIAIGVIAYLCVGCASTRGLSGSFPKPPAHDPAPKPPTTPAATPEDRRVHDAQARVDQLEKDLASAKAEAKSADEAKARALREASVATLRAWCLWLSIGCLLVAAACVALAIFLPAGTKLALSGAAAAVAVLVLLQSVSLALGYLVWIAVGAGVIVAGLIAWALWHNRRAVDELARFGTNAATALRTHAPAEWDRIKADAIKRQSQAKLQGVMDRLAARFKPAKSDSEAA